MALTELLTATTRVKPHIQDHQCGQVSSLGMPVALRLKALAAAAALCLAGGGSAALACSRVTWTGPDQQVITGRSMDWPYGFNSHFYVFPRGERINGAGGLNSLSWTSRYGAVMLGGSTAPAYPSPPGPSICSAKTAR